MNRENSIITIGSIALDTIHTKDDFRKEILGGSASYFSLAASYFRHVSMIGVVGSDFPQKYWDLYKQFNINTDNVEIQDDFTAGQLFLIAREAVHNAIKHAQPKAIEVCLSQQASRIVLTVRDDGCGTSADIKSSKGAGLHIMQHRALAIGGLLDIRSAPGQGTEVRCELT